MQTMLHININTLIYIVTTLVMGIGFIWKMKNDQTSTASVIKTELAYMKEAQEQHKEDFSKSLESIKEDFGQRLEEVRADLKEDISRLEKTQEKSNKIRERLAIVEHKLANENNNTNATLLSRLLDKLDKG